MPENVEHLKGRVKETAGWLTDDRNLEHEGKRDQIKSDSKDAVDDAGDAVKSGVDKL